MIGESLYMAWDMAVEECLLRYVLWKDFGLVQIFHLISGLLTYDCTYDCACISGIYHGSGGLKAANSI